MRRLKRDSIIVFTLLIAFICLHGGMKKNIYASCCSSNIRDIAYFAGDMLEMNLLYNLDRTLPILSTSFANLDNLKETSAFGRLIGDQIASRFSQHGYKVIELKLSNDKVIVQEGNGELVLSRDIKKIDKFYDVQAIIVGTYFIAGNRAFLSTKLVKTVDNSILSSYEFSLLMNELLQALVQKGLDNVTYEKSDKRLVKEIKSRTDQKPDSAHGKSQYSISSILVKLSNPLGARIVQKKLSQLGYYTSKIDGKWGPLSIKALSTFKKEQKLPNVDKWDIETQRTLFDF